MSPVDHAQHAEHVMHMSENLAQPMCKMHIIVFRSWHTSSVAQFFISCLIIVLIGVLFEWLRKVQRFYDAKLARGTATPGQGPKKLQVGPRLLRAALYGTLVFISFFIMLVFMTYNGYLIISVIIGAMLGHYILNQELDTTPEGSGAVASNGMACH
ncbi:hypothetical protein FRB99_008029 [Tulasnella sp. 403]|nr:hypothetical protein FRB99_008029 [Tulasnella sp. 403]